MSFKLNLSLKKETCQFNVQMSKKATSKEASFSCHMISSESRDVIRWSALSWTCPARLYLSTGCVKKCFPQLSCVLVARWSPTWCVSFSLPFSFSLFLPLLLCILQVMDRNRWIRNLGRKLKVYIQLPFPSFPLYLPSLPIPPLLPYAIRANRTSLLSLQLMPSLVRAFSQFLREKGACQEGRGE